MHPHQLNILTHTIKYIDHNIVAIDFICTTPSYVFDIYLIEVLIFFIVHEYTVTLIMSIIVIQIIIEIVI